MARLPRASGNAAGIRLSLVLSLAGLFVLGFVPLFFAVSSLTRETLRAEREDHARAMGRVVAARVAEAHASRGPGELGALVDAQVGGRTGLTALGVYDEAGRRIAAAGELEELEGLPGITEPVERVERRTTRHGPGVRVTIPGSRGTVVALLRTDDEGTRTGPLLRLVALYVGVIAIALLVFVYIALGRLVVAPLDRLGLAARRVAEGPREDAALGAGRSPFSEVGGPAETLDLGRSLAAMTARLEDEEAKLRSKVRQLQALTDDLRAAQASLVRSERLASVGRLSAGLAHEIGNPLAAISGMTDLLLQGGLSADEERDFLERTAQEIDRIARIVRDLLDFARPQSRLREDEPGNVGVAVAELEQLLRPQKSFKELDLVIEIAPGLPEVALSQEHLAQLVLNLLLNAAHAAPRGALHVSARRAGEGVILEVEDDGPGVDPAVAESLFEPFVTTKQVGDGTGLGLAVCRGLVEGAGGTIDVAPRRDGQAGARFVVTLPGPRRRDGKSATNSP